MPFLPNLLADVLLLNNNLFTGTVPDDYVFLNQLGELMRSIFYAPLEIRSSSDCWFASITDLIRLDRNSLTGEIPPTFCAAIDTADAALFADCLEVICSCCLYCCFDTVSECQCKFATVDPDQCEVDVGF